MTGSLFSEQTVDGMAAAITATERLDTAPEAIAQRASRFGRVSFRRGLVEAIAARVEPS